MDIGTAKLTAGRARGRAAPRAGHLGRHRAGQRRGVPARWPAPRSTTSWPAGGCRCWSAAPGCTCGRCWSSSSSPAPTRRCARGWRRSWPSVGPAPLHARLAAARPGGGGADPAQQRPADRPRAGGDRAHRRAVHRRSCPSPGRTTRRSSSASTWTPAALDERIAPRVDRMWAAGLVARSGRWSRAGCARAGPPAGRWATSRCCAASPASCTARRRRATRRYAPPGGSSAGSGPGSAATRGSLAGPATPRRLRRQSMPASRVARPSGDGR